ncbi:hypothetical protein KAI92_04845 [Candidatus Parcubacteria bacterium]|nr:hypothetical protein [Candidatus Parcubacteria bacterium]
MNLKPYNPKWVKLFEKEYEFLKINLIKKYPSGRNEYSLGKSKFINKVLKSTGTNN